jgi:hypothetical protein
VANFTVDELDIGGKVNINNSLFARWDVIFTGDTSGWHVTTAMAEFDVLEDNIVHLDVHDTVAMRSISLNVGSSFSILWIIV